MKKIKRLIKGKPKKTYTQVDDLDHLEGALGIDDSRSSNGTSPLRSAAHAPVEPVIFSGTPDNHTARVTDVHISVQASMSPARMEVSTSQLAPRRTANTDEIEEEVEEDDSLAVVSLADTEPPVTIGEVSCSNLGACYLCVRALPARYTGRESEGVSQTNANLNSCVVVAGRLADPHNQGDGHCEWDLHRV